MEELTYARYLKLERLLSLQQPRSAPVEHDEILFITIHQVYELWFKQILWELDRLCELFRDGAVFRSISTLKRVRMIVKTLVTQLDVLETMSPMSFRAFRDRLDTSSGFQSGQFRELEFLLGMKRPDVLRFLPDPVSRSGAERRLHEPSVVDAFHALLIELGEAVPAEVRDRPVEEATRPSEEVQDAVFRLYRERPEAVILFELMLDVDEGLQEWRYRHVKIVERTIGNKKGTGGSLGVEFLKRSLFHPVFPDLWAVRHRM